MKNLLGLKEEKLEELPNRQLRDISNRSGNRKHYWGDDYPSNKVKRFLRNSIGQLWNDVYSKFHRLDWVPKDMRDLEHIKRHVVLDAFMQNGKVYSIGNWRSGATPVDDSYYETFYVHPLSKRLCVSQPTRHLPRAESRTIKILGDYHQLLKLNGIWYEVKAQPIKPDHGLLKLGDLYYEEANVEPVIRVINGKVLKDIAPADGVKYTIHNGKLYLPAKDPFKYRSYRKALGPKDRIIPEADGKPRWMRYNDVDQSSFKITLQRQLNSKDLKQHGLKNDAARPTIRCKKCGGIVGRDCQYHYCAICEKPNDDCKCYR